MIVPGKPLIARLTGDRTAKHPQRRVPDAMEAEEVGDRGYAVGSQVKKSAPILPYSTLFLPLGNVLTFELMSGSKK